MSHVSELRKMRSPSLSDRKDYFVEAMATVMKHMSDLQVTVKQLAHTSTVQREELATLRRCLASKGYLSDVNFMVELHRHRFERVSKGMRSETHWTDIVRIEGIGMLIGTLAGPEALGSITCTSAQTFPTGAYMLLNSFRERPAQVYVCGGISHTDALKSVDRFDPVTGCWEEMPPMSECRAAHSAAVLSERLYVCGGHNGMHTLASVECFDPALGVWSTASPMLTPRAAAAAGVVASRLYMCGGRDDGNQCLKSVECFDQLSGCWEQVSPMPTARLGLAVRGRNSHIYAVGGKPSSSRTGVERLRCAECFDLSAGAWMTLPPMRACREGPGMAVFLGKLMVCGGTDGLQYLNSAECFDFASNTWSFVESMLTRRTTGAMAVAAGQVFIFGGACRGAHHDPLLGHAVSSVEYLDFNTGKWKYIQSMPIRRTECAAVSLRVTEFECT
eukprot:TRINITY_DN8487_c0_g1_i2.p1 TRINITY_DN8487_c0_g1~~TRINITY_DN8487_c0_g1_i2.p1  ORF type:complete len:446 (-),score=50.01 TRINITY_DN8487_c0_g1_i2:66-1403(-)